MILSRAQNFIFLSCLLTLEKVIKVNGDPMDLSNDGRQKEPHGPRSICQVRKCHVATETHATSGVRPYFIATSSLSH